MPNGHDDEFPWPGAYNREALEKALEEAEVLIPLPQGWKSLLSDDDLCDLIEKENLLEADTYWTVVATIGYKPSGVSLYVQAPRADIAAKVAQAMSADMTILTIHRGKLTNEYDPTAVR